MISNVTTAEMRAHIAEVHTLVAELDPGFRLLTDMTELNSMDEECVTVLGEMMDFYKTKGIAMVVRIIPDSRKDIGLNILSVFHYGRDVRTVVCDTMEEGLRLLNIQ